MSGLRPNCINASRAGTARICRECGVERRLTKPAHPWTNGQGERLNRTIKEAAVQRFHYQSTDDELNEKHTSLSVGSLLRQVLEDPAQAHPTRICLRPVVKAPG